MINKTMSWLLGQATDGQRKVVYATLALLLVWVFSMWAPGHSDATRADAMVTIRYIVGVFMLGNGIEHVAGAMKGKK